MSSLKKKPEKNKQSINDKVNKFKGKADKPKETNKEVSAVNKKHIVEVLDSTKKIVDSIKQKLDQQEIEDTFIDTLESTIENSAELAEEVVDAVVNSFSNQVEMNMDFNTEPTDTFNETNNVYSPTMLELLKENFEKSQQLTIQNTKELVGFYTENTNLAAVNINQKVVESINTQIESILNLQKEGLNKYKIWVSEILVKKE